MNRDETPGLWLSGQAWIERGGEAMKPEIDWEEYEKRVSELESEGLDRSDAQSVVDAEMMQEWKPQD